MFPQNAPPRASRSRRWVANGVPGHSPSGRSSVRTIAESARRQAHASLVLAGVAAPRPALRGRRFGRLGPRILGHRQRRGGGRAGCQSTGRSSNEHSHGCLVCDPPLEWMPGLGSSIHRRTVRGRGASTRRSPSGWPAEAGFVQRFSEACVGEGLAPRRVRHQRVAGHTPILAVVAPVNPLRCPRLMTAGHAYCLIPGWC
jgi:hypothetical protein